MAVPNPHFSKRNRLKNKLIDLWVSLLDLIWNICVLVTFLLIPIELGLIVYYQLVSYSFLRLITAILVLVVMIIVNLKLQEKR